MCNVQMFETAASLDEETRAAQPLRSRAAAEVGILLLGKHSERYYSALPVYRTRVWLDTDNE